MASLGPQIGSRVRKAIGAWVTQEGTSAVPLRTLALVCKALTPAHLQMPGAWVSSPTRLRRAWLTLSVRLCDLWSDDDPHDRLRETLTSWFSSEQEGG